MNGTRLWYAGCFGIGLLVNVTAACDDADDWGCSCPAPPERPDVIERLDVISTYGEGDEPPRLAPGVESGFMEIDETSLRIHYDHEGVGYVVTYSVGIR